MKDVELYQQILGLAAPWSVSEVELDVEEKCVVVHVVHEEGVRFECPECSRSLTCYDHAPERSWRHLDTCQFETRLTARIPRVKCPEHGVLQANVPWAGKHARFTLLMERLAIDVLLACQTIQAARHILGLSWDQVRHVMQRAVERGLDRKAAQVVPRIGVDEKAFRKGHSYVTIVCNIDRGTVEYVAEDRKKSSLAEYFAGLDDEQLQGLEAIAMDMWEPYVQATQEAVPLAEEKIVFDRFHIMRMMTGAVDRVRRDEHRELLASGCEILKKTKYLWLANEENVPAPRKDEFVPLKQGHLRTARAWAIKESLRDLWTYLSRGWARRFFEGWYDWAIRSRLAPVKKVARSLKQRLENIITYCTTAVTNGVAEGLNSKIMSLKRRAGGHRNFENFRTVIYFHCGGLELYP